uniref:Expressed protein n=1 Tax=Schizophyllum commune (strain H4-8 / FGSC 9210) TaxID=578458 RepID=D8Q6N9_SCHCM
MLVVRIRDVDNGTLNAPHTNPAAVRVSRGRWIVRGGLSGPLRIRRPTELCLPSLLAREVDAHTELHPRFGARTGGQFVAEPVRTAVDSRLRAVSDEYDVLDFESAV